MAACVGVHVGADMLTGIIFSRYIDPSSKDVGAQTIASIVRVACSVHMTYRGYQRTSSQGSTGWTRLHAYDAQKQSPAKSRDEHSDIHCALLGQWALQVACTCKCVARFISHTQERLTYRKRIRV